MTTRIIRDTNGVIKTGKFCSYKSGSRAKTIIEMIKNKSGDVSLIYIPAENRTLMQMMYNSGGSEASNFKFPTDEDWKKIATSNYLIEFNEESEVTFNIDLSKATPLTSFDYNEGSHEREAIGVNKGIGFAPIPYGFAVSKNFYTNAQNNISDDSHVLELIQNYQGDVMSQRMTASELISGSESGFTEQVGDWYAMHEMSSVLWEMMRVPMSYGGYGLNALDGDNITDTVDVSASGLNTTPNPMNNFILPAGEDLVIELSDAPTHTVSVGSATKFNDIWSLEYKYASSLMHLSPNGVDNTFNYIGFFDHQASPDLNGSSETTSIFYQGWVNGKTINIHDAADHLRNVPRNQADVAIWLFIPDQHVTITSTSHNIQYDLKHFSNGTAIYFYLAH